jgi:signal transduction histidine kinase
MAIAAFAGRGLSTWAVRPFVREHEIALAASQRFAQDAAHELRTPIAALSAELELLLESSALNQADGAAAKRALANVTRMQTLVQRLLILATRGQIELREAIDLKRLAEEIGGNTRVQGEAVMVRGDSSLLHVMLSNALDNAAKFSNQAPITVTCEAKAGWAVVSIADQGPGVPREFRREVFQPFFRTPQTRASGHAGYGLGLALIAHVAHVHGGDAEFLDVPNGATLRLRIPLLA